MQMFSRGRQRINEENINEDEQTLYVTKYLD